MSHATVDLNTFQFLHLLSTSGEKKYISVSLRDV